MRLLESGETRSAVTADRDEDQSNNLEQGPGKCR